WRPLCIECRAGVLNTWLRRGCLMNRPICGATGPMQLVNCLLLFALLWVVLTASRASAALLAYEGFSYPVGDGLDQKSGGFGFANSWQGNSDYTIGSGSLSFGSLQTSANHVTFSENNLANSQATRPVFGTVLGANGTTAWLSFLIRPDADPTSGL